MLQDVIQPPEHLPIEGFSSPIDAQILDFCDDGELFSETFRNSEVSSCSGGGSGGIGGCYEDSSFPSTFSPFHSIDPTTLSALLDTQPPPAKPENDVSSTLHCSWSQPLLSPSGMSVPTYPSDGPPDGFDQIALAEAGINSSYYSESVVPFMAGSGLLRPAPPVLEEDCLSRVPAYMGNMDPSTSSLCSFIDPGINGGAFFPGNNAFLAGDGQEFFSGGRMVGPEMGVQLQQELAGEYQMESGGVGFYGPLDSRQLVYGSCDGQVLGENQHLVGSCSSPTLASDMSPLDAESTFKVGRLSAEERKEKIHRYITKRNKRNFTKKIKYACRKTLADSRPRVRGRFAKNNDEFGEGTRHLFSNYEGEDEEVVIKEEEDMMGSSEIYAHLSGVNSFKCNYTLESWI